LVRIIQAKNKSLPVCILPKNIKTEKIFCIPYFQIEAIQLPTIFSEIILISFSQIFDKVVFIIMGIEEKIGYTTYVFLVEST